MAKLTKNQREQKLVNLCFEIGMRLRMGDAKFKDNEKCGEWIAQQLRDHDFDTKPCGLMWGVRVDKNGEFIK
tara:strand:- start:414 stop:629 length:216 start_codon:yes stop_codon:yes gene_type:complete